MPAALPTPECCSKPCRLDAYLPSAPISKRRRDVTRHERQLVRIVDGSTVCDRWTGLARPLIRTAMIAASKPNVMVCLAFSVCFLATFPRRIYEFFVSAFGSFPTVGSYPVFHHDIIWPLF